MVADRWLTDWDINPRFPLLTRANAGEVLPDPASPLAQTLVWEQAILPGWRDAAVFDYQAMLDDELSVERPEVVGSVGGYLYINATAARVFGARAPGLTPEIIDFTYFGDHPDVPPYEAEPWHENPEVAANLAAWMGSVLGRDDLPELRDDRDRADRVRADRPDLSTLTPPELLARARAMLPHIRHLFRRHLAITAASSIGPGVLAGVTAAIGEPQSALSLITSVGDVDSALPSHAMWALSRLDPASAEFREGFTELLRRYGSRGPNEWDIRNDTWETDPSMAHALIESMRGLGDDANPFSRQHDLERERLATTARIREMLAADADSLAQFEAGLRSAHLHLAGRERTKTNVIKALHEVRMAVRELGDRFDYTPSRVCMVLADELDAFVNDPDELRARVAAREQQYLELFTLQPPFIINGAAPPLSAWPRRGADHVASSTSGDVLSGVPGCPGVAEGIARVILHPADAERLQPGEVLIAPITDPSWTPMFVVAAAVVVNVGAQVSHAVIVSRELGIPCVTSVTDATERIPDGARVRVDGAAGTVTLL
jgi:pyruvate,water dikinase